MEENEELVRRLFFLIAPLEQTHESHMLGSSPDGRMSLRAPCHAQSRSPESTSALSRINGNRNLEISASAILECAQKIASGNNAHVKQLLDIHLQKEQAGLQALKKPDTNQEELQKIYNDSTLIFDRRQIDYYIHETLHEIKATQLALAMHAKLELATQVSK